MFDDMITNMDTKNLANPNQLFFKIVIVNRFDLT